MGTVAQKDMGVETGNAGAVTASAFLMARAVAAKEIVRCGHCALNQYHTHDKLCRRCHKPLGAAVGEVIPLEQFPVLAVPQRVAVDAPAGVGRALAEVRRSRGLSQRVFARQLNLLKSTKKGIPRTYVSKIENGKALPTLDSLDRFTEALKVDLAFLFWLAELPLSEFLLITRGFGLLWMEKVVTEFSRLRHGQKEYVLNALIERNRLAPPYPAVMCAEE